jgi:hypothetical protein
MTRLLRRAYAGGVAVERLLFSLLNPYLSKLRIHWRFASVVGAISISLLIAHVAGTSVFAASGGSTITTSPVAVDVSATPGSTSSTNLQVQNNAPTPIGISVKLKEFKAVGESGQAQIVTPPPGDSSASWVHFSQTSFIAQPGIWNNVVMKVSLPKTAAFGYYYAVLFSPQAIVNGVVGNSDTVKGSNAILVLLDAHVANENNTLAVQSFTVDKSSYQYLPVNFGVTVHNAGNIFTVPEGDIYISRTEDGPTINTLDINAGQGNVLPGTNRIFPASWDNGFPSYRPKRVDGQIISNKQGKPIEQLTWNFSNITKFRFGKYYAHLVLVYNNGIRDVPINGEVSFWVVPWMLVVGIVVFSLLILVGLWTLVRSILRRLKTIRKIR